MTAQVFDLSVMIVAGELWIYPADLEVKSRITP
jgi:hypothetical protein